MADKTFSSNSGEYIGLLAPYSGKMAAAIAQKTTSWSQVVTSNGQQRQWGQNYRLYHNASADYGSSSLFSADTFSLSSDNGDVVRAKYNLFRNFITHILGMTINQPPALDVKAANDEPDSIMASQLFKDVLDYYMGHWKNARLKKQLKKAVEYCLIMSNGYLLVEWDPAAGQPYALDADGGVVRDGDLYVKAKSVWDVFFDVNCEDDDELDWVIVRDYANRFELAARFPDKKQEIMNLPKKTEMDAYKSWGWDDDTDLVAIYKFYHRSNSVLPSGRFVLSIDADTVLYDGPNPYVDEFKQAVLPLLTVRAADGIGTLYGYSPANDIAPVQVAFNTLWTAILTNHTAFGIQNIVVPRGSDLNVEQLQGGLNVLEINPGMEHPKPLNFTAISPDSYKTTEMLEKIMEGITGMNSVVRGDPESSLRAASGRVMGLIQAMAVQFNSQLQDSYQQMVQDAGNMILRIVRLFARTDRVTNIVGKDKVMRLSSWSGQTFKNVGSVVCEQVNPMSKTLGGKQDKAEFMVQNHLISTPFDYLTVVDTGRLDEMTMTDQTQLNLIYQENEQLMNGRMVQALIDDNHEWHIKKHLGLINSPAIRNSSALLQVVLTHVQHHKDLEAQKANPAGGPGGPIPETGAMPPGAGPQASPPTLQPGAHLPPMPFPPAPPYGAPQPNPPPRQMPPRMSAKRKPSGETPTAPGPGGRQVPVPKTAILPGVP